MIPCFEEGELVEAAVDSVTEAEPVEIVVVDDGSSEPATLAALNQLEARVRVIRHEGNRGVAAARNNGLAAVSARYVFPLDGDDLLCPGTLAAMADRLDGDPEAEVCYGDYLEFGVHEGVHRTPLRLDPYQVAYRNHYPPSALFRRSTLEAVGGWTWPHNYEDWSLWMTLAERGAKTIHMGRSVIVYRHRIAHGRRLEAGRRNHPRLVRALRKNHPELFARIREHRRQSDLSRVQRLTYPLISIVPRPRRIDLRGGTGIPIPGRRSRG